VPRRWAAQARSLCGGDLPALADRIQPAADFDALVATPDVLAQLGEIRDRLLSKQQVAK
jgi:hypothetical protein